MQYLSKGSTLTHGPASIDLIDTPALQGMPSASATGRDDPLGHSISACRCATHDGTEQEDACRDALNQEVQNTGESEERTGLEYTQAMLVRSEQNEHGREQAMRKRQQERAARQTIQVTIRSQPLKRSDRIYLAPLEWHAPLARQRFR